MGAATRLATPHALSAKSALRAFWTATRTGIWFVFTVPRTVALPICAVLARCIDLLSCGRRFLGLLALVRVCLLHALAHLFTVLGILLVAHALSLLLVRHGKLFRAGNRGKQAQAEQQWPGRIGYPHNGISEKARRYCVGASTLPNQRADLVQQAIMPWQWLPDLEHAGNHEAAAIIRTAVRKTFQQTGLNLQCLTNLVRDEDRQLSYARAKLAAALR